jgi:hypothetical protein
LYVITMNVEFQKTLNWMMSRKIFFRQHYKKVKNFLVFV